MVAACVFLCCNKKTLQLIKKISLVVIVSSSSFMSESLPYSLTFVVFE